jgi:zinc transport system substrate-binding protein
MEEEEGEEEAEGTLDEHVWLSLNLAEILCGKIKDALSSLDRAGDATYRSNLNTYIAELRALDEEYQTAADTAAVKTLLFGDRFPFRYLADDYGLDYYAAFPGCSAETEASFETILFLSEKLADLNLRCVMVTESSDQAIAKTIIGDNPDSKILVMDAMQSVTQSEVTDGATYLDIMRSNLNVLKEALQG